MRGIDTFFAIKEQASLFTPRAIADLVSGDFLAFDSEGLSGRQKIIASKAIRRQAMQARAYTDTGTMEAGGSAEFTASNFVLDKLLPLIFHSKTGTATDAAGATYTLVDGGTLTPFSTFVGFDGPEGEYTRRFTGCKVNRATLSARVDDMLTIGLDVAAINKEVLSATATPIYPGGEVEYAYVFKNAKVELKAGDMASLAELSVESFELEINHNIRVDAYRLGSIYRRHLQEGMTEVTGSFTLDAATQALSGSKLNLAGGGTDDPAFFENIARQAKYASLKFTVIDPSREVSAGVPCELVIELPFVRLEEPDFNVRDAGVITGSARFNAYDSITVNHKTKLTI